MQGHLSDPRHYQIVSTRVVQPLLVSLMDRQECVIVWLMSSTTSNIGRVWTSTKSVGQVGEEQYTSPGPLV